jgi:regulator of protease activity HflC (stomatin/prohibitin superfamily)
MATSTESTRASGSEFDIRGLLARITLWATTWLLCVSPLFFIDKLPGNQLLRFWQTRGLWWVIALSVASNLVLQALIQWLCNARAERMSVQLWAASSALHFIPYVAALGTLAGRVPEVLFLSGSVLQHTGWLLYSPLALFITLALTTPKRLRIFLSQNRFYWPLSFAILFFLIVIGPFWLVPRRSDLDLYSYFLWWERFRRWWEVLALVSLVIYARNSISFPVKSWSAEHRVPLLIATFFTAFFLLSLVPNVLVIIRSGESGVLYSTLAGGTQTDRIYGEGTHLKWPWDTMYVYNVRVNQVQHRFDVLSINGLIIGVNTSIRFRPKLNVLGLLQKEIGPDYTAKIVIPQVQSLIRRVYGQFTPEEIYTSKRQLIESSLEGAAQEIAERYITLDALLVLSIELPPVVQAAIQAKLVQQQASEEMKFRISRETQEKERKLIEAEGIQRYNQTVRESLQSIAGNDVNSLLRLRGIDATLSLASSANAKVVVVGASDRLPLILDTATAPPGGVPPSAAPSPVPSPSPVQQPLPEPVAPGPAKAGGE